MKLTPENRSYTLEVGQSLENITCTAECDPECSFSWTKAARIISNTSVLSYKINEKSDAGTFKCRATRPPSYSASTSINLIVNCKIYHKC